MCSTLCLHPRVVGSGQCSHRRWTDAVPAYMHLLGFGEGLAVSAVADEVIGGESLSLVQLCRLKHPQADINDHIRCTFDRYGDQCQAVGGGDGGRRRYCV